ncbi:MAG: MFS transporter [Pseudomonadota bacterium]
MLSGQTTRGRFLIFGGLYFAQGVPWGFFTVALQLRLTGLGMTPGQLGEVLTMAWLPWAAKPLLGPLVDRVKFGRFGRRRPFVLLAELGMALTLLWLATVDPARSLSFFMWFVLVHNCFAAAQDVGVDALALDLLTPDERGRANGIMAAGKYAGIVAGGQGLLWIGVHVGWPTAFVAAVGLLLVPATLVWGVRETSAASGPPRAGLPRLLLRSFVTRVALIALVFSLVSDLSDAFLTPMAFPFFKNQLGYTAERIARLSTFGGLVGIGGSLLGGVLSDRVGRRRTLLAACLLVAVTDLVFAAGHAWWPRFSFVLAISLAGQLASGVAYAASTALFMDLTNPRLGATQFQVYMSAWNLRASGAMYVGGHVAERLAARSMFILGGALEVIPLALLLFLDVGRVQKAYARDADADGRDAVT